MASKRDIENAAVSGLSVDGRDVARVSRDGRTVTLRHSWPEGTDGRVWAGVIGAARRLARDVGATEVYAARGAYRID